MPSTPPPSATPSPAGSGTGRAADAVSPFTSGTAAMSTMSPASVPLSGAASIPVAGTSAQRPSPPPRSSPLPGRTRHGLALGLAAASVVPAVLGGASAAPASAASPASPVSKPGAATADQQPACGDPAASAFPISTRIRGGPDSYASGGGYGTWYLDLTNTTTETCRDIHPVLVLTDEDRTLTSDQIQLKFSDLARPEVEYRVGWEATDQDEQIGVFGDDGDDGDDAFEGFSIPAGGTVTVQVRMAFTSDTSPGRITARAAIVQRQHGASGTSAQDDGAWVGDSDDYPFAVVEDDDGGTDEPDEPGDIAGTGDIDQPAEVGGTKDTVRTPRDAPRDTAPDGARTAGGGDTPRPVPPGRAPGRSGLPELAATGSGAVPYAGVTVAGFLIGGGAMVFWTRRSRRPRR
ncbi:hypothetical protein ABZ826_18885 [Streptomyces sp. NPDC047515]|uniref:hypothetical protein n=1 Tax=Streptomyces sp. NPDC047515 TaxID=3155380 RepID=UPI0033F244AD